MALPFCILRVQKPSSLNPPNLPILFQSKTLIPPTFPNPQTFNPSPYETSSWFPSGSWPGAASAPVLGLGIGGRFGPLIQEPDRDRKPGLAAEPPEAGLDRGCWLFGIRGAGHPPDGSLAVRAVGAFSFPRRRLFGSGAFGPLGGRFSGRFGPGFRPARGPSSFS